ncbi:MAG: hypothetical protein IJ766_03685 [Clostridia bacterium]|nr:hypothetical protein [Clostridia bacterium]
MAQIWSFFVKIFAYCVVIATLLTAPVRFSSKDGFQYPDTAEVSDEGPAYDAAFQRTLHSVIFKDFKNTYDENRSVPIPGLRYTAIQTADGAVSLCDAMVPQGVCFAGDNAQYMLISAYCSDKDKKKSVYHKNGVDKHESVIYVMDADSGRLLSTVTLDNYSDYAKDMNAGKPPHAGGIAFDGNYLWVAKTNAVYAVDFARIQALLDAGATVGRVQYAAAKEIYTDINGNIDDENCTQQPIVAFTTDTRASYISAYQDMILIGEFQEHAAGKLSAFRITLANGTAAVRKVFELSVPKYTQGAAMADINGKAYLFTSKSAGRVFMSALHIYTVEINSADAEKQPLRPAYLLPNMAEDLAIKDGCLFTCYESASNPYYGWNSALRKATFVTDRVTATRIDQLIDK